MEGAQRSLDEGVLVVPGGSFRLFAVAVGLGPLVDARLSVQNDMRLAE